MTDRDHRLDSTRPHREIQITETGFSVRGQDILKSERTKRTIQRVKDHLVVEQSSGNADPPGSQG